MKTSQNMGSGLIVTRIEALGFRSLRYVSQRLGPFHVLVGPNASEKSAFLDVLAFLGDLQRVDLKHAMTVLQSLSSVYEAQVLLATHSPAIVRLASVEQMLCFARDEDRGTDVVAGPVHPLLRDRQGVMDLGALLASGALD